MEANKLGPKLDGIDALDDAVFALIQSRDTELEALRASADADDEDVEEIARNAASVAGAFKRVANDSDLFEIAARIARGELTPDEGLAEMQDLEESRALDATEAAEAEGDDGIELAD